ncbi:MAG: metal-dependent hydrolase [Actinomycetota bacterium]
MTAVPIEGDIVVRRVPFEFPDDLDPVRNPGHHEWSHMLNGASLTMPYLEPFLIATLREAAKDIEDPEAVKGFCAQEGQHYRTHRRYNEVIKANGYAGLVEVEEAMKASWDRIRTRRSLTYRLAYSAGFESMTLGVTNWLVTDRCRLFAGSDTRVASFTLWHMVEEVGHKRVAFDAYQAACGGYWQRALGVFTGSWHVFWWSRKGCVAMLKADGKWRNARSRLKLWGRTGSFFTAILPGMLRSAMPGHDPRHEQDRPWVREWIAGFAAADPSVAPMLDTSHPDIPVPFPHERAA